MAGEIEIADDLGAQQAVYVRGGGDPVTGPHLLSDACATRHVAPFEHQHSQPGAREVGGGDEAVMPGANADDDKVERAGYRRAPSSNAATSAGKSGPKTSAGGTV